MLKNTPTQYGLIAKGFHGLMTLLLLFQIGWGAWMADLNVYDPQYHSAPALHKALGLIIVLVAAARLVWRLIDPPPPYVSTLKKHERVLAISVSHSMYLLFFLAPVFGYMASTATGKGIDMFGLFEIPALLSVDKARGEWAGDIHECLAWTLATLIGLHIAGALKHRIIDKDETMKRMFGR